MRNAVLMSINVNVKSIQFQGACILWVASDFRVYSYPLIKALMKTYGFNVPWFGTVLGPNYMLPARIPTVMQ